MPGATNEARFTIEGTASEDGSGNRGYDAINGQTLDVTLEVTPSSALSATYSVYDPAVSDSPLASKDAPAITWVENSLKSITPSGVNDTVTIVMPASGSHSYLIRCQAITPEGAEIFERLVAIRTPGTYTMRKTIPAEAGQYAARADSDDLNEIIDAVDSAEGDISDLLLTNGSEGDLLQGGAVYLSGAGEVDPANYSTRAKATLIGLVNQATAAPGAQVRVAFAGPISVVSARQVGAWAAGERVYVHDVLGKLSNTPTTTAGKYIAEVGICLNTPGGGDATVLIQKRSVVGPVV